jgi:hypothetical protein
MHQKIQAMNFQSRSTMILSSLVSLQLSIGSVVYCFFADFHLFLVFLNTSRLAYRHKGFPSPSFLSPSFSHARP